MDRLQKILSARGVCSRRAAEELIRCGCVTVNGVPANLGDSADPVADEILVNGQPLPQAGAYIYLMLHKPRGYVTTLSDEKGRKNAASLVADCGERVYPVGRLDMDSEGLLLFTNDGEFANRIMHPSHQIAKVYQVQVSGLTDTALDSVRKPVVLDGYKIKAPGVRLLSQNGDRGWLEITIFEGRNRQVRRMCAIAGMNVLRLVRVKEGALRLGNLERGKWRYLTADEVSGLLK